MGAPRHQFEGTVVMPAFVDVLRWGTMSSACTMDFGLRMISLEMPARLGGGHTVRLWENVVMADRTCTGPLCSKLSEGV